MGVLIISSGPLLCMYVWGSGWHLDDNLPAMLVCHHHITIVLAGPKPNHVRVNWLGTHSNCVRLGTHSGPSVGCGNMVPFRDVHISSTSHDQSILPPSPNSPTAHNTERPLQPVLVVKYQ